MSIEGRIAIVSGAAGDIGGASALELARRGADVVMGDIADRDRAVDRIRAEGSYLYPFEGPGWGVELDDEKLKRLTTAAA